MVCELENYVKRTDQASITQEILVLIGETLAKSRVTVLDKCQILEPQIGSNTMNASDFAGALIEEELQLKGTI